MRGVTETVERNVLQPIFQLTRLMRGVTCINSEVSYKWRISTHTPHARRDTTTFMLFEPQAEFQLTRLMRGVTGKDTVDKIINAISTHTPHARRDYIHIFFTAKLNQFQLTRLMRGVTMHYAIL